MFTRYFSSNRKLLTGSILAGVLIALLCGSLQFFWSYHKREAKLDTLMSDLHVYMESYFDELKTSIDALQPLTLGQCDDVSAKLTSSAAFSINVRAFVLVRDNIAFCSSATGAMNSAINDLIPELDIQKNIDVELLSGTPMLPNRPAIAICTETPLFVTAAYSPRSILI